MGKEKWYESDNPDRVMWGCMPRILAWFLGISLLFAVIGGGVWAFRVLTSDVKGRGDAVQIKNDARNRIRQQEGFWDLYQTIQQSKAKIDVADAAAQASPDDRSLKANAAGVRTHCIGLVGEYNAKANKFSARDFLDAELPQTLESSEFCRGGEGR